MIDLSSPDAYHLIFGLALNLGRVRLQRAHDVMRGTLAARGGQFERSWFDAIAGDEEMIDELMFRTNSARSDAALLAKGGRR